MQELIDRIVEKTGLAPDLAEKATGIMLSLVKTQGDKAKVNNCSTRFPAQVNWRNCMVATVPAVADCWACWAAD